MALRLGRPNPTQGSALFPVFLRKVALGAAAVSFRAPGSRPLARRAPASGGRLDIEGPVVVARKGQARIERGHPWVFRSDVVKDGGATPGAVVRVAGVRGEPLGFAFWSASSEIRLRMLERGEGLAAGFLRDRIERALRWRDTVAAGAEAYRVVHGEGDGLPSLVVDRYGDYLAVQTLSQGTDRK